MINLQAWAAFGLLIFLIASIVDDIRDYREMRKIQRH